VVYEKFKDDQHKNIYLKKNQEAFTFIKELIQSSMPLDEERIWTYKCSKDGFIKMMKRIKCDLIINTEIITTLDPNDERTLTAETIVPIFK
jgi:hypothetical protein